MQVEEASGTPVLAQDASQHLTFGDFMKSFWGGEKLFVVWKTSLTVSELMLGCRQCGAVNKDVFSCLAFSPTAAEREQDCGHACLVAEGIKASLSDL
jgi:hypothetical protein